MGPPDIEARVELLRRYLADRPAAGLDFLDVGQRADGYTPAEIREIVNEAAGSALKERRPISQDDLLLALSERKPALKPEDAIRRRIGFQASE